MTWTDKQKRIYLLIALLGLIIGLVGGILVDEARGEGAPVGSDGERHSTPVPHLASSVVPTARRMCRADPPDYPGCSPAQARRHEAATRRMTRRHYHAHRWGQSHHEFRGLSGPANRKLRRLYHHAVQRYVIRHRRAGLAAHAAYPRYRTWHAFKTHAACSGVFGWNSVMPFGWCRIGEAFSNWGGAARETKRLTLDCDGLVLGAAATGAAVAGWTGIAVAPGAMAGAGGAAVGCAVQHIYDLIWSW
jgi:hypothetical protein